MGLWARFKNTTLYKSIYRNEYPDTPRNQVLVILNSVVLHLHPVKVPRRALRVSYTWGLGGLSLLMFLILTVTGIWLMFYYVPAVPEAYYAMKRLETDVLFGSFVRNLHRWAAHGMVISVGLHMVRVFYTGSYKPPREFNWVIGVALFLITLLLSFTGYLLPWDQLSYWAIQVGSNMARATPLIGPYVQRALLGGFDVGPSTLVRWYTLHVTLLPLTAIVLMAVHFWRVRKDGGISTPVPYDGEEPRQKDDMVHTWPYLVSIEAIMAVTMLLALALMATFIDAPLLELANPDKTPNPAKAPWYFLGLQELLLHMDPALAGVLVPAVALVLLSMLPYIDRDRRGTGIWFSTPQGLPITIFSAIYTALIEIALMLTDEVARLPSMPAGSYRISASVTFMLEQTGLPTAAVSWVGSMLIPVLLMVGIPWGLAALVRRRYRADTREVMIALFTFFVTSFIVLTAIGTFFRGESMHLVWPWQLPH